MKDAPPAAGACRLCVCGVKDHGGLTVGAQDMHYAEFAEDEVWVITTVARPPHGQDVGLTHPTQSAALQSAIKEYEANKWKVIGQKVGKPAKVRLLSRL